ncbi:MAG: Gfo/Idh/MocA family protein [bacterium]
MNATLNRRGFIRRGSVVALSLPAFQRTAKAGEPAADPARPVRIGVIGVGGRGYSLLSLLAGIENVRIPALCDIRPERVEIGQKLVTEAGQPQPEGYVKDDYAYEKLCAREDLDGVIIATPWDWHARMAVAAMKAGKYAGVEVPAAQTLEECWDLVDTTEKTGVPCMMLENWSFRRDNLAVLNMIRAGLLGETVHAQCAYAHDCVTYFCDAEGRPRWQGEYLFTRNRDPYPTHGLGPVLSWMDIHCGDRFDRLTTVATAPFGLQHYLQKQFGPDHPAAKRPVLQGDVVTTIVKTKKGKTITIINDMVLPRPYDNRWLVQGTGGIYSQEHDAVYLEGRSPKSHEWEPFAPYQKQYDHALWRNAPADVEQRGHGGPDYFELAEFVRAVRAKGPLPLDIYDSVTMSSVVALSEQSLAQGGAPVECPDFTRGKWESRKPVFAVEA